jgi:hypothetical protein
MGNAESAGSDELRLTCAGLPTLPRLRRRPPEIHVLVPVQRGYAPVRAEPPLAEALTLLPCKNPL